MVRSTQHGNSVQRYGSAAGFAYVALLCTLAVIALMLGITAEQFDHAAQREREAQLLFVGSQFRQAIASYYENSPGAKQYPRKLEDLLEDSRFPKAARHLRRIYADPFNDSNSLQLVRNSQGRIIGVFSTSDLTPIRNPDEELRKVLEDRPAAHYSDWKFIYQPAGSDFSDPVDRQTNGLNDPDGPWGEVADEPTEDNQEAGSGSDAEGE